MSTAQCQPGVITARETLRPGQMYLVLAAIVASGGALRLMNLGTASLWSDEAIHVITSQLSGEALWSAMVRHSGSNMVLYHLLLHYWLGLGKSEAAVRAFSALASVATLIALCWLGKTLINVQAGLIAASLLAFNPFHVAYSQEVGPYTLVGLLTVLSTGYLIRAILLDGRLRWLLYGLFAALLVYAHHLGALIVVSQFISILCVYRRLHRGFWVALFTVTCLLSPLMFSFFFLSSRSETWLKSPTIHDIPLVLGSFGGPDGNLLLILYGAFAIVVFARREGSRRCGISLSLLLSLWIFVPPILLFALSQRIPLFSSRYLLGVLPLFLLLVAMGICKFKRRIFALVALAVMLAFSLRGSLLHIQRLAVFQSSNDWRHATQYISNTAQHEDAVLFYYSFERFPFEYYVELNNNGSRFFAHVYPDASDEELLAERSPTKADDQAIAMIAEHYPRVWLVSAFSPNSFSEHVRLLIMDRSRAREQEAQDFGFVRVRRFDRSIREESGTDRREHRSSSGAR